jgi:CHAT domain-containing protein
MYKTGAELRARRDQRSSFALLEHGRLAGFPNPRRLASPAAEDVQRMIGGGTVLVDYAVQPKETLVWTITSDTIDCRRVAITEEALSVLVSNANARRPDALQAADLALVSNAILAPIMPLLRGRRHLIIVPDGPIAFIPFDALPTAPGRLLIDDVLVSYLPNAAIWVERQRTRAATSRSADVLAVGDPTLDRDQFPNLPPLPNARREVAALRVAYPSAQILVDNAANRPAIVAALPAADVFHFAGHALSNPDYPLLSSLSLAVRADETSTSLLLGADIIKLDLRRMMLAFLSACNTNRGVSSGVPPFTLASAFLAAGAHAVVAMSWDVDDADGPEIARRFYAAYLRGVSAAEALRMARLAWFRDEPAIRNHPERWAGVVALGGGPEN